MYFLLGLCRKMKRWSLYVILCVIFCEFICYLQCQLVVNVKNNGGDVYRENIEANTTQDSIILEFRKADGTAITQFIDGKNEIQIFRSVILPEEELGQNHIQTMCFVLRFTKSEFISSDAMSKLRQKNPSTVRHPEENRPTETFEMDRIINVAVSHVISSHISDICKDAAAMTYVRQSDLQVLSQILNRDLAVLQSVTELASPINITSCTDVPYNSLSSSVPCLCHYDLCVGWYPCGLKYCRGKDSAGRIVSYRCGIKTCSRCRRFEFRVTSKHFCAWDEPEFQLSDWQQRPTDMNIEPNEEPSEAEIPNNVEDDADSPGPAAIPGETLLQQRADSTNNADVKNVAKMTQKGENQPRAAIGGEELPEPDRIRQNGKSMVAGPRNVPDDDEDGE